MIGHRMRLLLEWTGQSVLATPVQRMAKLLSILIQEQQHALEQVPCTLHVTQARLASQARCSRQTANQLLQQLEQEGLIVAGYGQFVIPDWQRLDRFADGDLGRSGSLIG
jgi:CRP-like cAMP-binding protein